MNIILDNNVSTCNMLIKDMCKKLYLQLQGIKFIVMCIKCKKCLKYTRKQIKHATAPLKLYQRRFFGDKRKKMFMPSCVVDYLVIWLLENTNALQA